MTHTDRKRNGEMNEPRSGPDARDYQREIADAISIADDNKRNVRQTIIEEKRKARRRLNQTPVAVNGSRAKGARMGLLPDAPSRWHHRLLHAPIR